MHSVINSIFTFIVSQTKSNENCRIFNRIYERNVIIIFHIDSHVKRKFIEFYSNSK